MRATAEFIRLFVRGLKWDAADQAISFEAALKNASRARLEVAGKGKVLVGSSSSGTSVSYALPSVGDVTAEDIATICSLLLDAVDSAKAATPSITDDALFAAILAGIAPVRETRPDFSSEVAR